MAVSRDMSVLVVDDYKTMTRIMRNLLEQLGFRQVDEALDGQTAIELVRSKSYGLILSDWNMQPVTGLDLLKQVRSEEASKKTPFIMVTAESRTENVVAARAAGVNNYIIKPFNLAVLKAKMSAVLGEL